jgi:hypothetical protein
MKKILLSLVPVLLLLLITGCVKNTPPSPVILPAGTFSGTFTRLHLNLTTNKVDTIKANLTLTMSATTGFVVSGDTTHHAASHGGYVVDGVNIAFSDQTLPTTPTATPPVKTHLNGLYQYIYSGSTFQITAASDTLAYLYDLKAN